MATLLGWVRRELRKRGIIALVHPQCSQGWSSMVRNGPLRHPPESSGPAWLSSSPLADHHPGPRQEQLCHYTKSFPSQPQKEEILDDQPTAQRSAHSSTGFPAKVGCCSLTPETRWKRLQPSKDGTEQGL